ncbi:hypothetical protein BH11PLA2_BH11PLA2_47420 [soil metagenome]
MCNTLSLTMLLMLSLPLMAQPGGGRDRGQSGPSGAPGGGGPGGSGGFSRGGGMNPDDSFNSLLASYGGTGDVVDYSKVTPERRDRTNRFAQMANLPPMPMSGTITREQYRGEFAKKMEAMTAARSNGGGFSGFGRGNTPPVPGAPGTTPAPGGAVAMTFTAGGAPGSALPPNAPPPPPEQREKQVDENDVAKFIRKYDKDQDGRVSVAEAADTDYLKTVFAAYDKNGDRFLDSGEMRLYLSDRFNKRNPDGSPVGGNNDSRGGPQNSDPRGGYDPNQGRRDPQAQPEEEKPVVFRFGKLPTKELPSWWEKLDTDKDGQIGLYEWRTEKNNTMAEWIAMDLNNDGYLTAEEYIRYKKLRDHPDAIMVAGPNNSSAFSGKDSSKDSRGRDSARDSGKDSRSSGKDEKKMEKGIGKSNPFRDK